MKSTLFAALIGVGFAAQLSIKSLITNKKTTNMVQKSASGFLKRSATGHHGGDSDSSADSSDSYFYSDSNATQDYSSDYHYDSESYFNYSDSKY
jgi:hypothetical protein